MDKERLKKYRELLIEFGDPALLLNSRELDLLDATKKYFEYKDVKLSGLDVFEEFDESMDRVKKTYLSAKGFEDESVQEVFLKYPLMEKYYTDFFSEHEGNLGSNMKAVSMLYFWASHNSKLYSYPVSVHNKRENHPSVGSSRDWLSFTDGIYHLAAGSLKEYERSKKKILPLYETDTNATILKDHSMAVLLVGKVIEEAEHCDNYMDKSKYLFQEYQNALDQMSILDMDTELDNSPNKGDFYVWFDLVDSAKELCETGVTTRFEEKKQNVLKLYTKKEK